MLVRSAWLGKPLQLFEIDVAIPCDPDSQTARLHVMLSQPPPVALHRAASNDVAEPVRFDVDPESWSPLNTRDDPHSVRADFLISLPETHRASLVDMARDRASSYERLKAHAPSATLRRSSQLVYWADFEEEHQVDSRVIDQFFVGADLYIVTDCYCLNPDCDCRAANLVFYRVQLSDMRTHSPLCSARIPLDGGQVSLIDITGDRVEATLVAARWEANRLSLFLPELEWRYHRMRGTTAAGSTRRVDAASGRARRSNVHKEKRKRNKARRKRK